MGEKGIAEKMWMARGEALEQASHICKQGIFHKMVATKTVRCT